MRAVAETELNLADADAIFHRYVFGSYGRACTNTDLASTCGSIKVLADVLGSSSKQAVLFVK